LSPWGADLLLTAAAYEDQVGADIRISILLETRGN
jgi:hypothetical protein